MLRMLMIAGMLLGVATATVAQTATIQVDHPWARATTGQSGAVYMAIRNSGTTDDKLLAAATPIARQAQLHIEFYDSGIMKMRPLSAITVMTKGHTSLKPGGMHLMLVGLGHPLKEGDSFPLTLTFEKAGKLTVTVTVEGAGAMDDMPGMKM